MNSSQTFAKALSGVALLALASSAYSASQLDLTIVGNSGTINGATYTQMAQQPTGTGYIDPFVRVGMQGSAGKDTVQAYNTTVNGVFNNSNEDNWNHAIQFGDLQVLTNPNNGSQFVRFLLDINQTSANPKLNLEDVQIFISKTGDQSTETLNGTGLLQLADSARLVYRMDYGLLDPGDNKVTLDYSLNSGSGSGDMYLDIPVSMFTSAFSGGSAYNTAAKQSSAYVYLYSKFGSIPYTNNDGFEEWAFLSRTDDGGGFSGAPEPSTVMLAALAIMAARSAVKRRQA